MHSKMEKIKNMVSLLLFAAMGAISGCTPMDEYKKIAGDNEHSYPARMEISAIAGKGRILILGSDISDPKVTKCRIYWDLEDKFQDVPMEDLMPYTVDGVALNLLAELTLPEKSYSFTLYTYDALGNHSVPTTATGRSYGEKYESTISNRIIKSFAVVDSKPTITWYSIDPTLGAVKTVVKYKVAGGGTQTLDVLPETGVTELLATYDATTDVEYYTVFKPENTCVDTFETAVDNTRLN
ncbi:hypothetical protein FACS1894159_00360 [Bacteroidia bacterium]|nr:hypothetical protein FACS1894159_00360 [Bacteroidia bacterium]